MKFSREIQEAIMKLAGTYGMKPSAFVTGEVKSVNETDRTCEVETILSEGTITITVNLSAEQNDGYILIPAVESTVLVCMMPDSDNYALAFSDIDKVVCVIDANNSYEFDTTGFIWNGGLNGGLVNINVLTTALNTLQTEITTLKTLVGTAITVYSAAIDSGASATTFNSATLTPINITNIEDTKIKH